MLAAVGASYLLLSLCAAVRDDHQNDNQLSSSDLRSNVKSVHQQSSTRAHLKRAHGVEISADKLQELANGASEIEIDEVEGFMRTKTVNCIGRWVHAEKPDKLFAWNKLPPDPPSEECKDKEFQEHCTEEGHHADGQPCAENPPFFILQDPENWKNFVPDCSECLENGRQSEKVEGPTACTGEGEGPSLQVHYNQVPYAVLVPTEQLERDGATMDVPTDIQEKSEMQNAASNSCHGLQKCPLTRNVVLIKGAGENQTIFPQTVEQFKKKYVNCNNNRKVELLQRLFGETAAETPTAEKAAEGATGDESPLPQAPDTTKTSPGEGEATKQDKSAATKMGTGLIICVFFRLLEV